MSPPDSSEKDAASEPRSPDVIVRRVALVLVPLLLGAAYLLRSAPPEGEDAAPAESASRTVGSMKSAAPRHSSPPRAAPAAPPPSLPLRDGPEEPVVAEVPRAAVSAAPPAKPEPVGTPAVQLPEAEVLRSAPVAAAPASPCGGLFVRLITEDDDDKLTFASMATSYGAPAQVVHVGERIGSFRVTRIEWDRVWVQSASERCAVGMHFGAREAQEQTEKQLSAEEYARLPWVLPQSIVSGLDKRSEMEFELDEATIDALFKRGADVFAGLRVKAIGGAEGEPKRLELHGIRLDSFLERLGIEHGDVLVSVDDKPAVSTAAVVEALKAARDKESLVANFLRDGEPFELSLRLRQR